MRMKIPSRAAMKKTPKTGYQSVTKPRREAATTVSMRIVPEIIESPRFPSVESGTDQPTSLPDIRPFVRLFRMRGSPKLTQLRRLRGRLAMLPAVTAFLAVLWADDAPAAPAAGGVLVVGDSLEVGTSPYLRGLHTF